MTVLKINSKNGFFWFHKLGLAILMSFLAACSSVHRLPKTPNLYSAQTPYPVQHIASSEQGTTSNIFYVTDRNPVSDGEILIGYDKKRSASMALGEATLTYGDTSWDQLIGASLINSDQPVVKVAKINELKRFPETPLIFSSTPNGIVLDQEEAAEYDQSIKTFQQTVAQRLRLADQKDIILYIHGFNQSFENAVLGLNDVWHFSGRHGAPIAYTWPSGDSNLLGYFTDRESGEYTVYHLKETLRILSSMRDVENIHILAHSRGTDITTTALRELVIEHRAMGKNPRDSLKIANLIMAAPDLDYGVVTQRLIAEKFGPAFGQITIYMNENDNALGIAQSLMRGIRFGKLTADRQSDREAQIFNNVKNVSFVNVQDVSGFIGHGYFSQHPGALSDIITLIKTNSRPGSEKRPLTHIEGNFWALDKSYLASE